GVTPRHVASAGCTNLDSVGPIAGSLRDPDREHTPVEMSVDSVAIDVTGQQDFVAEPVKASDSPPQDAGAFAAFGRDGKALTGDGDVDVTPFDSRHLQLDDVGV